MQLYVVSKYIYKQNNENIQTQRKAKNFQNNKELQVVKYDDSFKCFKYGEPGHAANKCQKPGENSATAQKLSPRDTILWCMNKI
jgi:hypothetical protein